MRKLVRSPLALFFTPLLFFSDVFSEIIVKCVKRLSLVLEILDAGEIQRRWCLLS